MFSRVLDRPVKTQRLPLVIVRIMFGNEFYKMFRWFNDERFKASILELRRKYHPEVHLHTLEGWLREDGGTSVGYASKFPRTEPKKEEQRPWGRATCSSMGVPMRERRSMTGEGEVKHSVVAEIHT